MGTVPHGCLATCKLPWRVFQRRCQTPTLKKSLPRSIPAFMTRWQAPLKCTKSSPGGGVYLPPGRGASVLALHCLRGRGHWGLRAGAAFRFPEQVDFQPFAAGELGVESQPLGVPLQARDNVPGLPVLLLWGQVYHHADRPLVGAFHGDFQEVGA